MSDSKINYTKKWVTGAGTDMARVMIRVGCINSQEKCKFTNKTTYEKLKSLESSSRFYGIKIYPDRSYAEREHFKILLSEADRRNEVLQTNGDQCSIWVVRGNRVLKVKKRLAVGR